MVTISQWPSVPGTAGVSCIQRRARSLQGLRDLREDGAEPGQGGVGAILTQAAASLPAVTACAGKLEAAG
jgi:hypothetical protein